MKLKFLNKLVKQSCYSDWKSFEKNLNNLKNTQTSILSHVLETNQRSPYLNKKPNTIKNYEEFRDLPITNYSYWEKFIEEEMTVQKSQAFEDLIHFQPTSGSTFQHKWIPYTKSFLKEINRAANTWIYDLTIKYPKAFHGKQYWSLSWLPDELRKTVVINDSSFLNFSKKILLSQLFAVPESVSTAKNIHQSLLLTSAYLLLTKKLTLISVWSPTFLINLLDFMIENKQEILSTIESHPQTKRISKKRKHQVEIFKEIQKKEDLFLLWNDLALISCWTTSNSEKYSNELKNYFPNIEIQGKGLWTTEGVVTIPFQGSYCLSYQSHFYEFRLLNSNKVIPSWELRAGDEVSPIITAGNGIFRYEIKDRLVVEGLKKECPILVFKNRINSIDLTGEKISSDIILNFFETQKKTKNKCIAVLAIAKSEIQKKPYYLLIYEAPNLTEQLALDFENFLCESFHYSLARNLGQLSHSKCLHVSNAVKLYEDIFISQGMIKGNIKCEILKYCKDDNFFKDLL